MSSLSQHTHTHTNRTAHKRIENNKLKYNDRLYDSFAGIRTEWFLIIKKDIYFRLPAFEINPPIITLIAFHANIQ